MIENIIVKDIATFDSKGEEITPLNKINFFYGANGSGKTTISRVITNLESYPKCRIEWKNNVPISSYVYNRDFIDANFNPSKELKGIFTLGKGANDVKALILDKKKEEEKFQDEIIGLEKTLKQKGEDNERNENSFQEFCWSIKTKYDNEFRKAFEGFRGKKADFTNKCKLEFLNSTALLTYDVLKEKADKIFNNSSIKFSVVPDFEYDALRELEIDNILKTKIIGKEDIDISALIKKLNNSDWVKKGREYLAESVNVCPFCQQKIENDLGIQLEKYFDETYILQIERLAVFKNSYSSYVNSKISLIGQILLLDNKYIDKAKLEDIIAILKAKFDSNILQLETKVKEPSIILELITLQPSFLEAFNAINDFNKKILDHNRIIDNLSIEQRNLSKEVWRFVIEELKPQIKSFQDYLSLTNKAIEGTKKTLLEKQNSLKNTKQNISELELQITSVIPTVEVINKILKSFGFTSFMLAEDKTQIGNYLIVRKNGEPVKRSLSEGEKTFITFLYFYHLLRGSTDSTKTTENRIVVFDDPISSLDSNVLFIVSNLIRKIIKEIRDNTGTIKQIIVLTHNTYFHKEVTFNKGKGDNKLKDETFWIVRKEGDFSKVISKEKNPIKTSYELLWEEIREKKDTPNITLHNTLRRIIENYFKILGNFDLENIINEFEEDDKLISNSLTSWLHDGSHYVYDDLYIDSNPEISDKYLKVFRMIFEKTGHEAHYKMMMKEE